MSTLLIGLPPPGPDPATPHGDGHALAYGVLDDAGQLTEHGHAQASLLQAKAPRIWVVLPAQALSWHRIEWSAAMRQNASTKTRLVLQGLLEDQLLGESGQWHMAFFPQTDAPQAWVGVCHKVWLVQWLELLFQQGLPVTAAVPEFTPEPFARMVWTQGLINPTSTPAAAQVVISNPQGVRVLPLDAMAHWSSADWQQFLPELGNHLIEADPALSRTAQTALGSTLNIRLTPPEQHWAQRVAQPWNLLQFDLAQLHRQRLAQRLKAAWQALAFSPTWRAARWGLGLALAAQMVGLNAWAWHMRQALQNTQQQAAAVLTRNFPHVPLVVDARIQMERESQRLAQTGGVPLPGDFDQLLVAMASTRPAGPTPLSVTELTFDGQVLQAKMPDLAEPAFMAWAQALNSQGYRLSRTANGVQLEAAPNDPAGRSWPSGEKP